MSANHAAFNLIFRFIENYVSPIAGRISSQRHVMAIRDGFISAMPFMIVGSFLLVFAYPPFSPDTTGVLPAVGSIWRSSMKGRILTPFDMTMGIMSIYICAAIAYNLGKHYVKSHQLDPFMCAMLSLMAFLLVAAPKTNGTLPVDSLGGTGIFTAIPVAIYCVEMMRFLKAHNIGIRLPDQVPPMIKNSFDLLIPVLVVVLTLYPLSLLIQTQFNMLIPQAIMALFKPTGGGSGFITGHSAGGDHWSFTVVRWHSWRRDRFRYAANVLVNEPWAEPDRAGAGRAVAAYLYGSVLDLLYRDWWLRGDDGAGVLLPAKPLGTFTFHRAFKRRAEYFQHQ